ncbi:MAG TPA: AAA family ATPase, partial [Gammaproteobacteria bacterium]|nr:AAA family ATPase [Gammaproteobacteria bacterium]
MFLQRFYSDLAPYLRPNKALIIFGARQVGKTTLIKHYLKHVPFKYRLDSGDNIQIRQLLSVPDFTSLKDYASGYDLLVLDEAQKIENIGEVLKILVDQIPGIRIIATGSSSFELAGQIGEPLTGRKTTLTIYPLAQLEFSHIYNPYDLKAQLEKWLIYGSYPEIATANSDNEKRSFVTEIMQSYLLKDILELDNIKNSKILLDLLRLLAFQIGNLVSLSELGQALGIDYKTVARYIDLLEKSFVIFNLR